MVALQGGFFDGRVGRGCMPQLEGTDSPPTLVAAARWAALRRRRVAGAEEQAGELRGGIPRATATGGGTQTERSTAAGSSNRTRRGPPRNRETRQVLEDQRLKKLVFEPVGLVGVGIVFEEVSDGSTASQRLRVGGGWCGLWGCRGCGLYGDQLCGCVATVCAELLAGCSVAWVTARAWSVAASGVVVFGRCVERGQHRRLRPRRRRSCTCRRRLGPTSPRTGLR